MKKIIAIFVLIMLLFMLTVATYATVQIVQYEEVPAAITSLPNDTIPLAPPTLVELPKTGGIPMIAFSGLGVLIFLSGMIKKESKKQ